MPIIIFRDMGIGFIEAKSRYVLGFSIGDSQKIIR